MAMARSLASRYFFRPMTWGAVSSPVVVGVGRVVVLVVLAGSVVVDVVVEAVDGWVRVGFAGVVGWLQAARSNRRLAMSPSNRPIASFYIPLRNDAIRFANSVL